MALPCAAHTCVYKLDLGLFLTLRVKLHSFSTMTCRILSTISKYLETWDSDFMSNKNEFHIEHQLAVYLFLEN